MKATHVSTIKKTSHSSTGLRNILWWIGAVLGWTIIILATLLTGYFSGAFLLAVGLLGRLPVKEVFLLLSVVLVITIGIGWLVVKLIASARTVGRGVGLTLALALIAWVSWSFVYPDRALFLARQVAWSESNQKDYELFPEREVLNAAPAFHFNENPSLELFQTIEYRSEGELKQMDFEEFLQSTQTTSFIVIKDDAILYEGYFNGYERDSILTSFSVAKSFTSALVGIAIDEGYIGNVDDRMIDYIPELKGKGFDEATVRDLLMMSAGIRYVMDDELPTLVELTQFTDSGLSYSYPDLRGITLQVKPDGQAPGTMFNYNNYNTILLGMILERTTGRQVGEYLQEKIWGPLGMEYPASWSLDSEKSGFELMGSGINARAIDFAKLGRLYLNYGNWNGVQILPPEWVVESTSPAPDDHRSWHSDTYWKDANGYYKYHWWGRANPDGTYHYTALGHLGQFIFVAPEENMIIVRFGLKEDGVDDWMDVFQTITADVKEQTKTNSQYWQTSTPEEQGFDSAKLAEGLLKIKRNGTLIHSLMILRNDRVILDAYFYPYDGSIYHDLASVTKSVTTTLIGIAADQGVLRLEDTLLSFFPDREIANRDERKEQITVRHLASMSSGMDCGPVDDELTLMAMRANEDWIQYALDLPMTRQPGTRFEYCSTDMHLLSAILTQATGMPALEFGGEYLFGPLGISDLYWPADPQGITHGWGDLCLRPPDMAKLGSLFLHSGEWKGKQIVTSQWVESALQAHMSGTGKIEDYGYGWWVGKPSNEAEFLATGNGGQKIKVYPRLDMMIVMTGGGFEYAEIEPYVLAAMGDPSRGALPTNSAGMAKLHAALITIKQAPPPEPVPPLPAITKSIAGKTFTIEPNRIGLLSLRLDFDHSDEATLQLEVANEPGPRKIGIGLDAVYRPSHEGRPIYARGGWKDIRTFVIDYNEGPGLSAYAISLSFDGREVTLQIPGVGSFRASMQ